MKTNIILIFVLSLCLFAYADTDVESPMEQIRDSFFDPFEVKELGGKFQIYRDGNAFYSARAVFEADSRDQKHLPRNFDLKYFPHIDCIDKSLNISIIEMCGQRFSLGKHEGTEVPIDVMWDIADFWVFDYGQRKYFCCSTYVLGSTYGHIMLLFDITDIKGIRMLVIEDFNIDDTRNIGLYPKGKGSLGILVTRWVIEDYNYRTVLYYITREGLQTVMDGIQEIHLKFDWDKWSDLKILNTHIPQTFTHTRMYKSFNPADNKLMSP